jgi:leukotriene-A4 hydrolase
MIRSLATTLLLVSLAGCASAPRQNAPVTLLPDDPHSFSNPEAVVVRHLDLSLSVDFTKKRLDGWAGLRIENLTGKDQLVLDSNGLDIREITVDDAATTWSLGDSVPEQGQPLRIAIRPDSKYVRIAYSTRPDAAALQWLDPSQTAGGELPFLFTQSQAILARTWIPLQDTPGVRMTYSATVRVPRELMAVMSATNPQQKTEDGIYRFQMPQPLPSYLVALAVADLEFKPFDERTGVYAERPVIEKAAWEFGDVPQMMEAAEALYGKYRWDRYDILVLPPSFPFGGMEHPRLTFATPTLLAGDKSLVGTIAHELAHSWSGNLVTNATWNDFWLNEGFTTYFEQRIVEAIYGSEVAEMAAVLGIQTMREAVTKLGATSPDTRLVLDLSGRSADEGEYGIGYEKGHFFLRSLEERVGRPRFDAFLKQYFARFAFQSITTGTFVEYFDRTLGAESPELQAFVREWIYEPGIPASVPQPKSHRFLRVERAAAEYLAGRRAAELNTAAWTTPEWLHFFEQLPQTLTLAQLQELDSAFALTRSGNAEILTAWFERTIRSWYEPSLPILEKYLHEIGRRKLVQPLYEELAKTERGKAWARRVYRTTRPRYHSVTQGTVDKILGYESGV